MKRLIFLTVAVLSSLATLSASTNANEWLHPQSDSSISNANNSQQFFDLPKDGELTFDKNSVVATIELDNQSVLNFVQFADGPIAILEDAAPGTKSIDSIDIPENATISEVFYAFSAPGTAIPKTLGEVPGTQAKPQGWGRSLVNEPIQIAQSTSAQCNNSTFRSWFDVFNYNDRGTPDFRLDQVPRNSRFFERYSYAPGNGQSYRFYEYTVGDNDGSIWYNIDRYASRVAVCAIDSTEAENPGGLAHPPVSYQGYVNNHMGPVVRMMYRRPNENTWNMATSKDFAASDVGSTLSWHFYTGNNWDWRTDIYWAGGDDSFDIGHALEDL